MQVSRMIVHQSSWISASTGNYTMLLLCLFRNSVSVRLSTTIYQSVHSQSTDSFLNATSSLSLGQACMVILAKSALNISEDCTSSSGRLSYWLGSRSVIRTRFEVGPMSPFYITSASDMTFSRIQTLPLFPRWRSVALSCVR